MDSGVLKIFKAVADQGSVSRAAQSLNCVQSNVTTRIRRLEAELDVPLFFRKKRGMVLTPAGKILETYADRILRLLTEADRAVRETEMVRGPLHIGTLDSTAAARLPAVLTQFRREYPDVDLSIRTGSSEQFTRMVLAYQLDGAFVGFQVDNPDIRQEAVFREELVIVSERSVRSVSRLETPTLLVFPHGCTYRTVLENWLQDKGRVPFSVVEFGTIEGILGCVTAGLGIAMFPRSVIQALGYSDKLTVHRIDPAYSAVSTMFIRRRGGTATKAMAAFLNIIRKAG